MAKIICSLPNASEEINGVAFERHRSGGVISKGDIDAEILAVFASIPGYTIVDEADVAAVDEAAVAPAADDGAGAVPAAAVVPAPAAAAPAAPVVKAPAVAKKKPAAPAKK